VKVVIFLVAFLTVGCSGPLITVRPLPTNDAELYNLCYDVHTQWPNHTAALYTDRIVTKCTKLVNDYNERRINEGKIPYVNDPNLVYWSYW
jgi:hypothetical protein